MRTARSSSRPGGSPPGTPRRKHPLGGINPLEEAPHPREEVPPPGGSTPWRRHPPGGGTPVNRMTNRCKNIILPQTSFAGGKNTMLTIFRFPDNVHPQNAMQLIRAMNEAQIPYQSHVSQPQCNFIIHKKAFQ